VDLGRVRAVSRIWAFEDQQVNRLMLAAGWLEQTGEYIPEATTADELPVRTAR
jgi:hypothetical protein